MAKPPRQKHSHPPHKKPVTIDLAAEDVAQAGETPQAEPVAFAEAAPAEDTTAPFDEPDAGKPDPVDPEPATAYAADPERTGGSTDTAPHSPRRGSAIAGGAIGGLLALAIAGAGQWLGVVPVPRQAPADTVTQGQFAELRARVNALGTPPAPVDTSALETIPVIGANLEAVSTRVADLESRIANGTGAGNAAALEALAARIAKLESAPPSSAGSAASGAEIQSLRQDLAALAAKIADAGARADAASDKANAMEEKMATLGSTADIATPIAAAALKSAVDRGGPFTAELETYAGVTGDTQTVEKLRALAGAGVPTVAALQADFGEAANAMLDAMYQPDASAGIVDRLMNSARGLVRARPVGEVEGDTAQAIVARMEARLGEGNLEAALAEYGKLPEPAKVAGAAFAARIGSRIEVNGLIAAKLNAALGAAGK